MALSGRNVARRKQSRCHSFRRIPSGLPLNFASLKRSNGIANVLSALRQTARDNAPLMGRVDATAGAVLRMT